MKRQLFTLMLVCAGIAAQAFGSGPIYNWVVLGSTYTFMNDKLEQNNNLGGGNGLNAAVFDHNGLLWLAVPGKGLRTFDGKKLTEVRVPKESYARSADVLCLAVDSKNTIWMGTGDGLVKYDGTAWTNIDQAATGMLTVTSIALTATDKVYISGQIPGGAKRDELRANGISFFNGQTWANFNKSNSAIPDDSLENLVVDGNNHLWAIPGRQDAGVVKFDGKNWKEFNTSNTAMPTNNIRAIATNSTGKIWLAATKGIVSYDGTDWKSLPFVTGFGSKRLAEYTANGGSIDVASLMVEPNNTYWVGTRGNGVFRLHGTTFKVFNQANSLIPRNGISQILIDKDRRKWFVTGNRNEYWGAYYLKGNNRDAPFTQNGGDIVGLRESEKVYDPKWTFFDSTSTDLRLGSTMSIGEDKEGNIWMPNDADGLVKYKNGERTVYRNGAEFGSAFNKMFIAADDKIYLNTNISGIKVFDHGTFKDYAKWPNMGGVSDMAFDKDGKFWASGMGGLSLRTADDWETFNKRHGDLPSVIVYTVFKDSKGNLWAGTAKGLVRKTDTAWQVWRKGDVEFPSDDITAIAEGPDGRMWFGTKAGISIYDGTNWTHIAKIESPKVSKPTINGISFDKNGTAWIATYESGLLRYDGKTWTQYDAKNGGTILDRVTAVKAASDGKIYVASEVNEFGSALLAFPGSSPADVLQNDLRRKVGASDPKKIIAVFEP